MLLNVKTTRRKSNNFNILAALIVLVCIVLAFTLFGIFFMKPNKEIIQGEMLDIEINSDTLIYYEKDDEEYKIHYENCFNLNLDSLWKYHGSMTSGSGNIPDLLKGCEPKQDLYYGYYYMNQREDNEIHPVVATIAVSYKKNTWFADDKEQQIILLIVESNLFRWKPLGFNVGDSLDDIQEGFDLKMIIEDIHYYQKDNCILAIQSDNNVILRYLYWTCTSVNFDEIHPIIKNMRYFQIKNSRQ